MCSPSVPIHTRLEDKESAYFKIYSGQNGHLVGKWYLFFNVTDLGQPDQSSPATPTFTRVEDIDNMNLEAQRARNDEVLAEWDLFL